MRRALGWLRRRRALRGRTGGQVLVIFAVALVPLVAMVGLVADGGTLYLQRRTAQNSADAGALAGAHALMGVALGSSDATVATAICTYVLANRFGPAVLAPTALFVDSSLNPLTAVTLSTDCAGVQSATTVPANANGVKVTANVGPYNTYLVGIVGVTTLRASATGTASMFGGHTAGTVVVLNDCQNAGNNACNGNHGHGSGNNDCISLLVTGGASLTVTNGNIYVDSTCNPGLSATQGATIRASTGTINVVGTASSDPGATISPAAIQGAPVLADPFAALAIPNVTGPNKGAVDCSGGSVMTITPGIYSHVNASGGCVLTATAGSYIIGDRHGNLSLSGGSRLILGSALGNTTIVLANGMDLTNGATVVGTNVLFYNACLEYSSDLPGGCARGDTFGVMRFSGGADFSGVTPQASGPYQNMTFFQDRNNAQVMTMDNGTILNVGTIYGKSMPVTMTGGANVAVQFVVDSLGLSQGAVVMDTIVQSQEALAGSARVGMTQ